MARSFRIASLTLAVAAGAFCIGAVAPARITLGGNGLTVSGKKLAFGTPRAAAIAAVTAVLGKATATGNHGDCGQGDEIGYAKFRGEFELSFVKGRLSGWTEDSASLATDRGVHVGITLAALRQAYGDVSIDPGDEANGGLGPSFQREDGPNGWIDGTKATSHVTGLYAGATCLAGV